MALVVGTNSYITLADAETYFAERLNSTEWDAETDANKTAALIQATKMIDFRSYLGGRYVSTQALAFPRAGLVDDGIVVDDSTVPQKVIDATCELALYLLQEDYSAPDDLSEFSAVKVGPIEIDTKSGGRSASGQKTFPPFVLSLLAFATAPAGRLHRG